MIVPLRESSTKDESPFTTEELRRAELDGIVAGPDAELAGFFDIDVFQTGEEGEILVGDGGDGDIVDINLGAADEIKEEVEGTVEAVERNLIIFLKGHGAHIVAGASPKDAAELEP